MNAQTIKRALDDQSIEQVQIRAIATARGAAAIIPLDSLMGNLRQRMHFKAYLAFQKQIQEIQTGASA